MKKADTIEPVAPGAAMFVLPRISTMLALGGRVKRDEDAVTVSFMGDEAVLHFTDFEKAVAVAKKVADEMRMSGARITPVAVMQAMETAGRLLMEEYFEPGVARVIYYPSVSQASALYRCHLPAQAASMGGRVRAVVARARAASEATHFDVVVIQIDPKGQSHAFMKTLQAMGKKVVYEIDDAFDCLNGRASFYDRPGVRDDIVRMMKDADACVFSTPFLEDRYGMYAKRHAVIPNTLPVAYWPKAEPNATAEFRVLWAGSDSHMADLAMAMPDLVRFANEHDNVRLIFFGARPPTPGLNRPVQARFVPFADYTEYPTLLAAQQADVALAPLVDEDFNRARSDIKLIEYGATGYPVIASDVGPYEGFASGAFRVGSLLGVNGAPSFYDALEAFYDDEKLRLTWAAKSRSYAEAHDVSSIAKTAEDFFLSLKE